MAGDNFGLDTQPTHGRVKLTTVRFVISPEAAQHCNSVEIPAWLFAVTQFVPTTVFPDKCAFLRTLIRDLCHARAGKGPGSAK
ncbi:MAG: hypothetical protein ABL901_20195 [Hyphomicrobiaceae bacterium]